MTAPNSTDDIDNILDDLYVSTHGGRVPIAIKGSDEEPDVLDFKEAKAAIQAEVQRQVVAELKGLLISKPLPQDPSAGNVADHDAIWKRLNERLEALQQGDK